MLSLLIRRAGEVLSRTLIAEQVWGMNCESDTNVADIHVRRFQAYQPHDDELAIQLEIGAEADSEAVWQRVHARVRRFFYRPGVGHGERVSFGHLNMSGLGDDAIGIALVSAELPRSVFVPLHSALNAAMHVPSRCS